MSKTGAHKSRRRFLKLRARWWVALALLVPIFIVLLFNLVFSTALGTDWAEKKVSSRLGLGCEIEKISWWPWAGFQVRKFRLSPPDRSIQSNDLCLVREIQIDPSWLSLIQGEKRFDRVEIVDLTAHVSVEFLRNFLTSAENKKSEISSSKPVNLANEDPEENSHSPEKPPEEQSNDETEGGEATSAPSEPKEETQDAFEAELFFSGVNLRLYSEKFPNYEFRLSELQGEIPLWGSPRSGEISCEKIEFGEDEILTQVRIPVAWEDEVLSIEKENLDLLGIDFELKAAVKLTRGLPLGLEVNLPNQELDFSGNSKLARVRSIESRNLLQGYLLSPGTMTGANVTRFEGLSVLDPVGDGPLEFTWGFAQINFSSGVLIANDFRVIGDQQSILANGFITTGGSLLAAVRSVTSPDRALAQQKKLFSIEPMVHVEYKDLLTPDCQFFDIKIQTEGSDILADLGENGELIPLTPIVKTLLGKREPEISIIP